MTNTTPAHTFDPGKNSDIYQRMIGEIQDYAIILLDKNGTIRNWNTGAEKIKLYTEQEIVGKHFSIFYFPEDVSNGLPERLLNGAALDGKAHHEGLRRRKDGSGFWGSVTITALHDSQDDIIGFVKVTRDLTERKIAEDSLRISEQRYHQMISEVQDYAIILLDEEGIVENWNAGAEKIKGYSSEEIVGKRFDLFYTSEDRARNLPDKLLALAKTEGRAVQEGWRVRKNGTRFWGTIVITALHDKNGKLIGFSKVTRDLTEKKIAEEQLLAYTAELEIRNKELEQFAYVASHDLQEPLRKIRTFAQLIKDNFRDEEFVERYLGKLDTSAKRMGQLIHSLLNFSRLTKTREEQQDTDLGNVLKEVLEDMELVVEEKKATITHDPLPVVPGYALQLQQLFSNIISNALKFAIAEPVLHIGANTVERSEIPGTPKHLFNGYYAHIAFRDNGIGFEQEYSELIFSLFQRLHEKHTYEGTGIGLALCRKIADNHNGHIFAEGQPGAGTTIHVYLPLKN